MTCFPASKTARRGLRLAVIRGLLVAGCALIISGCKTSYTETTAAVSIPNDVRLRHPITVKEADHTIEIFVGARRGSLTPVQRADVLSFAQSWKREATGGIIIDLPLGTTNEIAAQQVSREIASILTASGIPPIAIKLRSYLPINRVAVGVVKLNYPKMTAESGPCGLWPADLGPGYESSHMDNKPYWNFGCAHQRNLAAMVENPADLVQPRAESPAYTARRTLVLDKYHKGTPTGTTFANPDQGKISDVGK